MLRRLPPQLPRHLVQGGFILFFLWIGIRFYQWKNAIAATGIAPFPRPDAVDGFLPISGLMNLRYWLQTGELFPVHPAAALILLAALLTGLLLKRGFCAWICPVFALGEVLWRFGHKLFGRNFIPPFWIDLPLRSLKYLLLAFFLYAATLAMSLPAMEAFFASPYHQIVDVRMLHFFISPSTTVLIFVAVIIVLSVFVKLPWCRYLCPYGALLGLVSLASIGKIRRFPEKCVRCNACSHRCPASLPVMLKTTIRSAECFACYRCVAGCPAPGALHFTWARRWIIPPLLFAVLLLTLFIGVDLYGRSIDRWHSGVPDQQVWLLLQPVERP
ncbi:MAG: 4Fe-4S binding protein [Desulfuromonadales bacterium]|nr:4Fe-4S binding protein [Desulfuromonadales bacterium]